MNPARPLVEWAVPAYLPYVQPRLTPAAVRKAEAKLGIALPAAYVAALRVQNGGYLRRSLGRYPASDLWGIGPRFPSILEGTLAARCSDDEGVWLPKGADALVPFSGDGHWYLCFDARRAKGEPSIAFVDLECERISKAASSFEALMKQKPEDPDDDTLGIIGKVTLGDASKRLAKALGTKVVDQGTFAHGYRTFFGRTKTNGAFWVSPNAVPRGFIRRGEEGYRERKGELPGTALRIPEHPDVTLVVLARDVPRDALLAACEKAGLAARVLSGWGGS